MLAGVLTLLCAFVPNIAILGVQGDMKIRDVIKMIEADGWVKDHQTGSHRQYAHPVKKGLTTIAGHPSEDILPKTLASICVQAQIPKPRRK